MSREGSAVPVSYAGRGSIHLHGGLLYEGDSFPTSSEFAGWEERLETQANSYLEGFDNPEKRTMFHLTVRREGSPRFEVRAEVIVLLGAR